ncbi:hypothetical protein F442_19130 [Phytophthora nicotianae P10297]|uniref:Uncharacterized protein n=1 Tax=Phytophthora nicotianae P10297 TaxID=1317064 RepID=W2YAJ8_PHYNI|nr:hypothetical protein F442_19130 [Phytophthora nicotianae P10297]
MQTLMRRKGKVLEAERSPMASYEVITDRPTEVCEFGTLCEVDIASPSGAGADFMQYSMHTRKIDALLHTRTRHCVLELLGIYSEQATSVSYGGNEPLINSRDHSLRVMEPRDYEVLRGLHHKDNQLGFDWILALLHPDDQYTLTGANEFLLKK